MYDPDEESEPPMLYMIEANKLRSIFHRFPLEKKIFVERAKERLEYFENFKAETLLKFMKGIIKNPTIIR